MNYEFLGKTVSAVIIVVCVAAILLTIYFTFLVATHPVVRMVFWHPMAKNFGEEFASAFAEGFYSEPKFVRDYLGWFRIEHFDQAGWTQPMGWGLGETTNDHEFLWFAWLDSDSRLHIGFDFFFLKEEVLELEKGLMVWSDVPNKWKVESLKIGNYIPIERVHPSLAGKDPRKLSDVTKKHFLGQLEKFLPTLETFNSFRVVSLLE